MRRQRFFQPFLQAPGSARIDPFQLPEDFLQRLFGLRVVVHRISIAHPPVEVLLATGDAREDASEGKNRPLRSG
jgi:hypothetical protein